MGCFEFGKVNKETRTSSGRQIAINKISGMPVFNEEVPTRGSLSEITETSAATEVFESGT